MPVIIPIKNAKNNPLYRPTKISFPKILKELEASMDIFYNYQDTLQMKQNFLLFPVVKLTL